MNKEIAMIVAIADHNAIGNNNGLLCHVPGDLPRFKQLTTGHTVIMGRKTFLSLPKGALPNRTNIVMTTDKNLQYENCIMVHSVEDALAKIDDDKIFIIGGAEIYKLFLPHTSKLYITRIYKAFDADTFFPEFTAQQWKIIHEEKIQNTDIDFDYSFQDYTRVQSHKE